MDRIILENDKTIFKYLDPMQNDKLSELSESQIMDLLTYLDKYYLECRDSLFLPTNATFGIEIEIEYFKGNIYDYWPFQLMVNDLVGNKDWDCRNDTSLFKGREIVSEILTDVPKTWKNIEKICNLVYEYGLVDVHCSSHVHVGSQILGENTLYWYRLFKLWSIYENVIYRFSYGNYLTHRPGIVYHAKPSALFLQSRLGVMKEHMNNGVLKMLQSIRLNGMDEYHLRKFGISYWHMLADDNYDIFEDFNKINKGCTIEYRCPNPDLDVVIRQNLVNFFIKFMLYCKSDEFDESVLDRRKVEVEGIFSSIWAYSDIYLKQAVELCDLIFDNNLDKLYFLRQYIKSFETADKPFVKAKKFTATM